MQGWTIAQPITPTISHLSSSNIFAGLPDFPSDVSHKEIRLFSVRSGYFDSIPLVS